MVYIHWYRVKYWEKVCHSELDSHTKVHVVISCTFYLVTYVTMLWVPNYSLILMVLMEKANKLRIFDTHCGNRIFWVLGPACWGDSLWLQRKHARSLISEILCQETYDLLRPLNENTYISWYLSLFFSKVNRL